MKAAILFLLCICLFLTGKNGHTDMQPGKSSCHFVQNPGSSYQGILDNPDHHSPVIRKTEAFVSLEDEDDGPVFSRKYVLMAKCLIALINASGFADLRNIFKNRVPFCSHLSDTASNKYILQRVLRI